MFVTYLYRVRAGAAVEAVARCEQHMRAARADIHTPLYVVGFESGERAVLVGPDDWRKRRRQAGTYDETLCDEAAAVRHARKLRIFFFFHLLIGSPALRRIRETILGEYESYVTGPETERTFFAATDGFVRDALRNRWNDEMSGPLSEYMDQRAEAARHLYGHTTQESFPFTDAQADIAWSLCFDLPGAGRPYYVVTDVHR